MTAPATLSWRIPHSSRKSLRSALVQTAFVAVVVGVLVVFLAPTESQAGLLTATVTLSLLSAVWQFYRTWRESSQPANVWLDDAGLHWLDAQNRESLLPRSAVRRFYVGRDLQTHRDRPALTLLLDQEFLSQPVELHAPVDAQGARQWLTDRWNLEEAPELPTPFVRELGVASEIDVPNLTWHLAGSPSQLANLAAAWREAANFPLPPIGARPKQLELVFENEGVSMATSSHTLLDRHYFAATPEVLRDLVRQLEVYLVRSTPSDLVLPLITDTGHHWKLSFSVVEEEVAG